jgi:hypothetical protein
MLERDADCCTHHRQRRAQLVRSIRHKAPLLRETGVETPEQFIKSRGEISQFVTHITDRQSQFEIFRAHAPRLLSHAGDRQ